MADLIKSRSYEKLDLLYGDVVRLTRAVRNSSGKRYKFIGAMYDPDDPDEPQYLELIEIRRGAMRSIYPEHVVKDVNASKAARKRREAEDG